jgi:hypothetical protein
MLSMKNRRVELKTVREDKFRQRRRSHRPLKQLDTSQSYEVNTMSFRLSTLITAGLLGIALAGSGNAIAGDGKSCGGNKDRDGETSAAIERPTDRLMAETLRYEHLV